MTQIRNRHSPTTPKQAAACCGPLDMLLDPELFKALSDPTRVSLIACIAKCGRGCSVTEVAECCSVDMSVVSRHLTMLDRAGVLEATKEGRSVSYVVRYGFLCKTLRKLANAIEDCCPPADAESCKEGCCAKR